MIFKHPTFLTMPLGAAQYGHSRTFLQRSTTRFTAAYGTALGGRVAYAVGHTGLGVGAARFSADVALDLLDGSATERTRYGIVRRRPFPVPPEPLRHPIIQFTRRSIIAADAHEGRRNLWLRLLDRFGLGFNS